MQQGDDIRALVSKYQDEKRRIKLALLRLGMRAAEIDLTLEELRDLARQKGVVW